METIADKYTVECTPDGGYYAYLCNHEQCLHTVKQKKKSWKIWRLPQKSSTMNSVPYSTWKT